MEYRPKRYTDREFYKILKNNGCVLIRQTGDHKIYRTKDGKTIAVNFNINAMVAQRLIKECNFKI